MRSVRRQVWMPQCGGRRGCAHRLGRRPTRPWIAVQRPQDDITDGLGNAGRQWRWALAGLAGSFAVGSQDEGGPVWTCQDRRHPYGTS